jgi:two-component SAPR family response regulator
MSLTLMIIDDDPIILFIHKIIIEKSEFASTPLQFSNGQESLDFLSADYAEGKMYLIFLDINMPGMSGWSFIENVNKCACRDAVSIVMVSSSIDLGDYSKASTYKQVVSYIEKPININNINLVRTAPVVNKILNDHKIEKR